MVELKVNVDGVQRIICGVSEATKCQDIIFALAQATGQIGRFNLVERCQDSERSLRPQENPLRVMSKWGPNSKNAYFLLRKTGTTPGNSRPPSVTKEISDRFKQVNSPAESVEDFPQQRQASLRRSQTFSGYRGTATVLNHQLKEAIATKDQARHRELSELVSIQQERINHQYQDLIDLENIIETLVGYESQHNHQNDSDSGIEEFELRSKRNKVELRELEFWESELEIEHQLQLVLKEKMDKLKSRIEKCDQELLVWQQEIGVLTQQVEEQRERLRLEEANAAETRLVETQEEMTLLQQEYEECTNNTQEMDLALAELNQSLDEKRSEEMRLMDELARENMREFSHTPSPSHDEMSVMTRVTQTLDRPSRQRAESTPTPSEMYATFPFRRLVSARHLAVAEPSGDNPEGIFV